MKNKTYSHGGNVFGLAQKLDVPPSDIIDLSSNIAPQPLPLVDELFKRYSEYSRFLPEPFSESLVQAIAKHHQLPPSSCMVGAGTTELLQWIFHCFAQQSVLLIEPTYSDYRKYANQYQLNIHTLALSESEGFELNLEKAADLTPQVPLVVLCNPNNPTGNIIAQKKLCLLLENFPETLFVIDESYMPFVANEDRFSSLGLHFPNVLVLRSLSKIFALPGLRIGWAFAQNPQWIRQFQALQSPWSVNSIAQKMAEHLVVCDTSSIQRQIEQTKHHFLKELAQIPWLTIYPSVTNFVLCRSQSHSSAELYEHCALQKILIRNCDNFPTLDSSFVRFSIKSTEAMNRLVTLLKNIEPS